MWRFVGPSTACNVVSMRLNMSFSTQVQEVETGIWCKCQIMHRPATPSPEHIFKTLGLHKKGWERRAAALAQKAQSVVQQIGAVVDRTNAMGSADCLIVRCHIVLPFTHKDYILRPSARPTSSKSPCLKVIAAGQQCMRSSRSVMPCIPRWKH